MLNMKMTTYKHISIDLSFNKEVLSSYTVSLAGKSNVD